jgi:hypothetical protein
MNLFRNGIVCVAPHQHADAPHAVALLRIRQERPRRDAPDPRNELPPSDRSITKWIELLSEVAPGLKRAAHVRSRQLRLIGLCAPF